MTLRSINDLGSDSLRGRRVLVRLDLNVPVNAGVVADAFRLEKAKPTIDYLLERGARLLVLAHLGSDGGGSLRPVADYYQQTWPTAFLGELGAATDWATRPEALVFLENIRREPGELTNDPALAARLAALGDLYVNEAFSVSHRPHTSVVGVPALLPSYAGLNLLEEVTKLSLVLKPERPFLVIIGGAKFSTKLPLIQKFLPLADQVWIGGALACTWFKAAGYEVGLSLVDQDTRTLAPLLHQPKIFLPTDLIIKTNAGEVARATPQTVPVDATIVDVGPETIRSINTLAGTAKTILWNGPLGYFEGGFSTATEELARLLVGSSAQTIIGGGDTVAAIQKLNLLDKFTFVSTAGGAMLDFLVAGTLPGIEALARSQQKFHLV